MSIILVIIKEHISINKKELRDKALRRSLPIIHKKSVLRCCKPEFAFFLPRLSFTNIYDSQDNRESGTLSLYILSTTSTRFADI